MSKPFDLEAAKNGAEFQCDFCNDMRCHFIGLRRNGQVVFDTTSGINFADVQYLHMCPTKVVRWVNIYRFSNWGPYSTNGLSFGLVHDQEQGARNDTSPGRVCTARLEWEE